jgi:hypothetical protein
MTSEEYDKLTDEEVNLKINELCGWELSPNHFEDREGCWINESTGKERFESAGLPDYLNDLNACHEFETGLDPTSQNGYSTIWEKYCLNLEKVCIFHNCLLYATSEQRCKAFVLTLTNK